MPRAQSRAISTARRRLGHTLPSPTFTRLNLPHRSKLSDCLHFKHKEILSGKVKPQGTQSSFR